MPATHAGKSGRQFAAWIEWQATNQDAGHRELVSDILGREGKRTIDDRLGVAKQPQGVAVDDVLVHPHSAQGAEETRKTVAWRLSGTAADFQVLEIQRQRAKWDLVAGDKFGELRRGAQKSVVSGSAQPDRQRQKGLHVPPRAERKNAHLHGRKQPGFEAQTDQPP